MIELPKIEPDPVQAAKLCKCRPVCKSRRREWKGKILNTSAELLIDRKQNPECFRRWPSRVHPNSPCPLSKMTKYVVVKERHMEPKPKHVVRLCQAPLDDTVDTPYLRYAEMARKLDAWAAIRASCAFCTCGPCCPCGIREYMLHDEERNLRWHADMRSFDKRVKDDYKTMRIMYDKIL